MRALDELRQTAEWMTDSDGIDACVVRIRNLDALEPNGCEACRHWRSGPGRAALGKCCVSGSFRAPGGLFTQGDFWCCHWTKS